MKRVAAKPTKAVPSSTDSKLNAVFQHGTARLRKTAALTIEAWYRQVSQVGRQGIRRARNA